MAILRSWKGKILQFLGKCAFHPIITIKFSSHTVCWRWALTHPLSMAQGIILTTAVIYGIILTKKWQGYWLGWYLIDPLLPYDQLFRRWKVSHLSGTFVCGENKRAGRGLGCSTDHTRKQLPFFMWIVPLVNFLREKNFPCTSQIKVLSLARMIIKSILKRREEVIRSANNGKSVHLD